MEHLNMQTPDGAQLNLDALYKLCPSCFTEGKDKDGNLTHKVNWNKLRELLGDYAEENAPESYDFTWVGKRAAQREAAAPINKTLRPCPEESVDWENTQNLYIEGDNLEVLKLLQNSYMGKVKMIYIDPPYNTGNDFVYHDDFAVSAEEYDENNINEEGERFRKNTDSNGRFHSDWCSMMYARLMVARTLLREDGVIFISIDKNEENNLLKICNEVFGEVNYISSCIRRKNKLVMKGDKTFKCVVEPLIVYSKNKNVVDFCYTQKETVNSDFSVISAGYGTKTVLFKPGELTFRSENASVSSGIYSNCHVLNDLKIENYINKNEVRIEGEFKWSESKIREKLKENAFILIKDITSMSMRIHFQSQTAKPLDYIDEKYGIVTNEGGIQDLKKLGLDKYFSYPKPVDFIKFLCNIITDEDGIIMDFFSGSATTAHAVFCNNAECGRKNKFIMVQLQESLDVAEESVSKVYKNLCEIGKERIRRAGAKIKAENPNVDTGFRVFKCDSSNMKDVYFHPDKYSQDLLAGLEDNIKEDRTDLDLLFDCMLRWGVELSLPLSQKKVGDCTIHNVNDGDLVACFDGKITEAVIDEIATMNPLRVVFRDSSFEEASEKMNLFELFKQKCQWSEQEVKNNVRVI